MNKRIAVCISGYPRLYRVSYLNFKKMVVLKNPEIEFDFFLYIKLPNSKTSYFKYNIDKQQYDIEDIISCYKPKKYVVDREASVKNLDNLTQQCGNVYKCIKIKHEYEKEHCINYDYVFKYRFDLYIENTVDLSMISYNKFYGPLVNQENIEKWILELDKINDFEKNITSANKNTIKKRGEFISSNAK